MSLATPLLGLLGTDSEWYTPRLLHWNKVKPAEGQLRSLFPHVSPERAIDIGRDANFGAAQAQLSKLETALDYPTPAKVHSFRNWAPTCADQLRFPREERERLGRWAPGSAMPDRYDKAVCATELRLRNEILEKIRPGWRPRNEFELEIT